MTTLLVESTRRDDAPALRRARVAAASGRLVGITMDGDTLGDLRLDPGTRIGISSPGRFGVLHGAVLGVDRTRDAVVIEIDPVVVPLRDRRGHQRTAAPVELVWPSGSATTLDVSPGGVCVVGAGPSEPTRVTIVVAGTHVEAETSPVRHPDDAGFTRLRFVTVVPELAAARVIRAVTFGR